MMHSRSRRHPPVTNLILLFVLLFLINCCRCKEEQLKEDSRTRKISFSVLNKILKTIDSNAEKNKENFRISEVDRNKTKSKLKSVFRLEKHIKLPAYKITNDFKRLRRSVRRHAVRPRPNSLNFCALKIQSISSDLTYECRPSTLWKRQKLAKNRINGSSRILNFTGHVIEISNASRQWLVPDNVTFLRLHQQNVGKVNDNSFYFLGETLRHLRLDWNVITTVSENAFAGLENLVELDLSQNRLHSFPRNTFTSLVNLKILILANNQIDYVGESFLASLSLLSFLDLSENEIIDVHENAFHSVNLSRSLVVNLRRNQLTRPRRGWLIQPRSKRASSLSGVNTGKQPSDENGNSLDVLEDMHRIFWGQENPWICKCSYSVVFLQTLIQTRFSAFKKLISESKENLDSYLLKDGDFYKMGVDINLPCSDAIVNNSFVDLGLPFQSAGMLNKTFCSGDRSQIESPLQKASCQILSEWLKKYGNNTNQEEYGITNGQVTVIGILIVVLCPILLTLCPDCNKTPRSHKDGGGHESIATAKGGGYCGGRSGFLFIRNFSKRSKT